MVGVPRPISWDGRALALAVVLVTGGCSSEPDRAGGEAGGATTTRAVNPAVPSRPTSVPTTALVDPALAPRTIAVDGAPEVGATLTARISSDLEGRIDYWTWHRCIDVPACPTIRGARGPSRVLAEDDAWQVLRVIAVAGRR